MKARINLLSTLLLQAIWPLTGMSQSVADIQKKFPGEQAVVLNHSLHYHITLKDNQPQVQSEEDQQLMFLSSDAGARLSQYSFYHGSFDTILQYTAFTKTAEGKKIKVTDFKTSHSQSEGVFYDDVQETSFDFPGIAAGAVGTLDISTLEKDPHMLTPFYFFRGIPVLHALLKITFPSTVSVKYLLKGIDSAKVSVSEDHRHGETTYTFQAEDLAAERAYEDAPGSRWYTTHVIFYIEKYLDPSGKPISYMANPGDLYKIYRGYLSSINNQIGTDLHHLVDSLCKGVATPREKAQRIYSWVQQNIRYIAFEQGMEGFIPRDANLVCNRRFGDCKDMSSILTTMLKLAGVDAYYTWIGTRKLPYTYTETPLPLVDNHMISTIRLGQEYIFLDATDPACAFGMPSVGIQDKQAMLAIDDTAYKLLQVPIPAAGLSRVTDTTFLELTDQSLKGRVALDLTGYYSMGFLDMLSYLQDKDKEKRMSAMFHRGSNKFQLDSFSIGDLTDKAHIRLSGQFTLRDYAKHIGSDWYLNMNLFKFYEHEEIDYPKRRMPIEFDFYNQRKYVVVLKIPKGYHISYMPAGKTFHNKVWGFDMSYEKKDNALVFSQEFDNDRLLLNADQFSDWNKVLENLFPLYKESISLTQD
ncbi:MAG TPA: DUF3857 domain-containing protein [Puia sp.]|nr:DUF3857 domain-containing protein [Puia sp.]